MSELDPLVAGAVFVSSFAIDGLAAYYTKAVAESRAGRATGAGLLIGILGYINLAAFIGNPAYAVPELAGGMVGTYLVVRFDRQRVRPQ